MNGELLSILEHLEREKGIDKKILIEAVESALLSAARKVIGNDTADVSVKIDPKTGAMKIFSEGKEIHSAEFGRIAAQTAKQIIIQKIREAERDVIYGEYHSREGSLVTGTVHRFEKGNIIVDLGKAEGVLPKMEMPQKEHYRQGERIKAYVTEVVKTPKGPRIMLSRRHDNMLKKLFETEVPEITEGIVEIKSVAREPGDRSKIAVISKDEKVDSVGACVGVRGQRVKNIVRELYGEKIDIVRYSDDIAEYIKAALSPAEIVSVEADKENKSISVMVNDDQLSLAIGKRGQNVRLAAKLTGWVINISSKSETEEEAVESKKEAEAEAETELKKETKSSTPSIDDLPRVGKKMKEALIAAGYKSLEDIAGANVDDLVKIEGIGKATAEKIVKTAKELIEK
ncbi:MAG: transcription termination/antitermination protein NusA [Candidatus Omnitrophica bacterium]|nr:transcription termination/antitermination protein NusA [Candidatus Omnitrophota bacterium]